MPVPLTRPGVLERGGRSYRVEYLEVDGARIGHMRRVDYGPPHGELWRWAVYATDGRGDYIGEDQDRTVALRIAHRCWAEQWLRDQRRPELVASVRQVGPSSRRPGSGPQVGVVYAPRETISAEDRAARALDCVRWMQATGAERERLRGEYSQRWNGGGP